MIFTCQNCGYTISVGQCLNRCPDCGEKTFISSNENRVEESNGAKEFPILDVSTIKTEVIPCFKYKIPLSEFGINSDRIMEMVVECEEVCLSGHFNLTGYAWAREPGDTVSGYLGSICLNTLRRIAPENQVKCLLDAICNDSCIRKQLEKYIATLKQVE